MKIQNKMYKDNQLVVGSVQEVVEKYGDKPDYKEGRVLNAFKVT